MGTRGFLTFVADGVEKTTYNHSDSYPGGLGHDVLTWLRTISDWSAVHKQVNALRVVSDESEPTSEDIERLRRFADKGVGSRRLEEWYVLLRLTQGDPAAMLEAGIVLDASDFPVDSLFAEWGYVVDLDAAVFEVYRGFQQEPHERGRFAGRGTRPSYSGTYYPVALVKSWPLDQLPADAEFFPSGD